MVRDAQVTEMRKTQDQLSNSKRKKIVHDFAKWTAQSALRSGSPLKFGKQIYNLIENHANLAVLFEPPRAIDQGEFDDWHKETILAFCEAEPLLKTNSQVGWAAKIINVYLKTRAYLAGEGREGLVSAIHPPIDKGLQEGLIEHFPNRPWKIRTIKSIRSYKDDYFPLIEDCRCLAEIDDCLPIELEFYWRGTD